MAECSTLKASCSLMGNFAHLSDVPYLGSFIRQFWHSSSETSRWSVMSLNCWLHAVLSYSYVQCSSAFASCRAIACACFSWHRLCIWVHFQLIFSAKRCWIPLHHATLIIATVNKDFPGSQPTLHNKKLKTEVIFPNILCHINGSQRIVFHIIVCL